jgi:hypothetical protein
MESAAHHTALRPFGALADLDLDFADPHRAALVTAVLASCSECRGPAFWWSQPVGVRTQALLRLVAATEPERQVLSFTARCEQPFCREPFDFELPLQVLLETPAESDPIHVELHDGRSAKLRRPIGDDLRQWRAARPTSRDEAVHDMLEMLVIEGEVGLVDEAALTRSFAVQDPLVAFSVSCRCPACDSEHELPIDLEGVALARLGARQAVLLDKIHRLASHYGWTESEVLAVASWRRTHYLALIEAER